MARRERPAEVREENQSQYPADPMNLFPSAREGFQKNIGDEAEGEALIDAEGEGNRQQREEGGDRFGPVAPSDFFRDPRHKDSDGDQRRGRSKEGDRRDERVEEETHKAAESGD